MEHPSRSPSGWLQVRGSLVTSKKKSARTQHVKERRPSVPMWTPDRPRKPNEVRAATSTRVSQEQCSTDATRTISSGRCSRYGECTCLPHCKDLCSWGRITQTIGIPSKKKTEDLTMKWMFDTSEKLMSEQLDEICGVKTINWENSSWTNVSLIDDEQVILQRSSVHVFSDFVLCLMSEILSVVTSPQGEWDKNRFRSKQDNKDAQENREPSSSTRFLDIYNKIMPTTKDD